jgi:Flp pilus assembly protein TadB
MNPDERPYLRGGAAHHDAPRGFRAERIAVAPKTWWGKLLALIAGVAAAVAAFFVSLLALAFVVGVGATVAIYLWWATRHARRAMRDETIEGVVSRREID